MASNGENQTSSSEPSLTTTGDEILVIPEIRPRATRSPGSTHTFLITYFQVIYSLQKLFVLFYIYMAMGTLCFYLIRHQISGKKTNSFLDALYFTIVLMTSFGYGDLTPDGTLAILLASLFAFMGTILMGLLLSIGAQNFIEIWEVNAKDRVPKGRSAVDMKGMCIVLVGCLVFMMVIEMVVLASFEDLDFIHALYCIVATISSVGSDKCFSTVGGRIFALFWMLYSYAYLVVAFFSFTEVQTQRKQRLLMEKRVLEKDTTPADFQPAADIDRDRVLSISEYTLYKLSEMGKLSQEDMTPIMEDFRKRDVNNKGGLTLHDFMS